MGRIIQLKLSILSTSSCSHRLQSTHTEIFASLSVDKGTSARLSKSPCSSCPCSSPCSSYPCSSPCSRCPSHPCQIPLLQVPYHPCQIPFQHRRRGLASPLDSVLWARSAGFLSRANSNRMGPHMMDNVLACNVSSWLCEVQQSLVEGASLQGRQAERLGESLSISRLDLLRCRVPRTKSIN